MPIYEYRCGACGHELEAIQKIADAPLTDCPECGETSLKKLISSVGFRFKGGGWYETDFKTGNKRNIADGASDGGKKAGDGKNAEPAKKGDSSSTSKSDGKPSSTVPTSTKKAPA